ncbi:MAG: SDR family oxidoreductase [bacterium]|nr:SDR family oxidoreductase [Candidatus Colisoma equi]
MNLVDLSGKRILVTGASSGIGRACAILISQLGGSVVLTGRRAEALDETLRQMENQERHLIHPCDICDSAAVAELVKQGGKIDGLVHAAGIGPMCPIGFIDEEHIQNVMKTNYFAFLDLMKHYSKAKNHSGRLSVVAISSVSALAGWGGGVVYCGSKGALSASVRSLALELSQKGIRVNAVCPSNIKTPMYETVVGDVNDTESEKAIIAKQPLGLGEPEQVASAVAFLLSDAASFITGVNLPVDGGYLAQ